jgi:hypothetical protein
MKGDPRLIITGATTAFILNIIAFVIVVGISLTYGINKRNQNIRRLRELNELGDDFVKKGIIRGKFRMISGNDCNAVVNVYVQNNILYLVKLESERSNNVLEIESYIHSTEDKNKYFKFDNPQNQVHLGGAFEFYISYPGVRNCTYLRVNEPDATN